MRRIGGACVVGLTAAVLLTGCGMMAGKAPDTGASANTSTGAAAGATGDAHHVVAGAGRPVGGAYDECVNAGHSAAGGAHAGSCGAADTATANATPPTISAPVPAAAQPEATAAPQPLPEISKGEVVHAPAIDQLSLQADALFQFAKWDSGSLLPAGKARLDELAARIGQLSPGAISSIAVTGHADRLGSGPVNQQLSQRRAETVKQYLVGKGIAEQWVQVNAKGEAEPVVACKGQKATAKLKACLAANRRVEVVVYGQK